MEDQKAIVKRDERGRLLPGGANLNPTGKGGEVGSRVSGMMRANGPLIRELLIDGLEKICDRIERIADRAEKENTAKGDLRALAAFRENRETIMALAKLAETLKEGGLQVSILASPEWLRIVSIVVDALDPYPEAKAAVLTALKKIGDE